MGERHANGTPQMGAISIWQWLIFVVLVTTVANGIIAQRKGRSVAGWVVLGLMFNPIAFVVLLCLPSRHFEFPARRPDY